MSEVISPVSPSLCQDLSQRVFILPLAQIIYFSMILSNPSFRV